MPERTIDKHPTILKDKATGNHALDSYAYARWPHLFAALALKYSVPPDMLLTLLFLWDRTVGTGDDCGDCAMSQIPVRARAATKWLAAFVAADFFSCMKAIPGGADQRGSFYEYKNPSTNEWDEFFRRAEILQRFGNWDAVPADRFALHFRDIKNPQGESLAFLEFINLLGKGQTK